MNTTQIEPGSDGWIHFSVRSPTVEDLPFVATGNGTGLGTWETILPDRWDRRWTAWRSIGPLPKPVDDGERLANQYASSLNSSRDRDCAVRDYMAGYAAGLKKGERENTV